jgi:uncharacterized membrane protein YtjA (UPF0391 family)
MLYFALVFLVVGLIAGALNLAGVAAIAVQFSWILFVIGVVLVVIHLVTGRRTPVEGPVRLWVSDIQRHGIRIVT